MVAIDVPGSLPASSDAVPATWLPASGLSVVVHFIPCTPTIAAGAAGARIAGDPPAVTPASAAIATRAVRNAMAELLRAESDPSPRPDRSASHCPPRRGRLDGYRTTKRIDGKRPAASP